MLIKSLLLSCALLTIPVAGLRAEDPQPAAKAKHPETELEKVMTQIGRGWRTIRKATRDGTLAPATAAIVADIRANAEKAATMKPALEADKPEAERAKFQADYEAQMKKLVAKLAALEASLKANEIDLATKLIGEIGDLMKSGHHDFRKPEEHPNR